LNKILGLLETKEKKITSLSISEANTGEMLQAINKLNQEEIKAVKKQT